VLLLLGGFLVNHELRNVSAVYGFFAIVLGLIWWIFIGAQLTLYAAETNVVLARRLWPRSMVQPPLTRADELVLAAIAKQGERRPEVRVSTTTSTPPATEETRLPTRQRRRPPARQLPPSHRRSPTLTISAMVTSALALATTRPPRRRAIGTDAWTLGDAGGSASELGHEFLGV